MNLTKKLSLQKPLMLLALIIIAAVSCPTFLTPSNILSILLAVCIYGVMACGTIFPLLNGGIDLSIGSVAALSGSVMVLVTIASGYSTGGTILGIVLGLLAGTACGALNGLISYYFALPAFVVTLAMKNIILGVTQHITNRNTVICLYSNLMNWIGTGKILGVQFLIILFVIVFLIAWFALNRSKFGRYTYAVGGNEVASRYSGVNSRLVGISAYAISGFTAALSGVMLSCFNRQAVATQASGYDGNVLVMLVVGGVSMAGGEGSITGVLFGMLLIGIINNAMLLIGIGSMYQDMVQGILIVLAVALDVYSKKKKQMVKAAKKAA